MSTAIDIVTGGTRGLRRDAEVLRAALGDRWPSTVCISRERNAHALPHRLRRRLEALWSGRKPVVLCSEILPTPWLDCAHRLVLLPNQEWMRPEVVRNLPRCAAVFCKTRYAESIFAQRGFPARYIGFTGADLHDPEVPKDDKLFLHIPGRSDLKGTALILSTWRKHPEWPRLRVISSRAEFLAGPPAPNLELLGGTLSDADLRRAANEAGVHLCLSETEGFGHYISEALSTGAVTLVTDAPPMNELVNDACAIRVPYAELRPMSWSERYLVSEADFTAAVERALALSVPTRRAMGDAARQTYLRMRAAFEERLVTEVAALIDAG